MKLVIENDLKENTYTVSLNIVDVTEEDKELFSDYGNQNVEINCVVSKTTEETTTAQVPKVDENGQPVLDGDGNQIIEEVTSTTTKETVLVNEPTRYKALLSDFPITKKFTLAQCGENAEYIAMEYGNLMEQRVKVIITDLKSRGDNFSGIREVIL